MSISYSLVDGKVKITINYDAISTATETREAYIETKILKTKSKMLTYFNEKKTECQNVIDAYTQKTTVLQAKIDAITAL